MDDTKLIVHSQNNADDTKLIVHSQNNADDTKLIVRSQNNMPVSEKLEILAASAKYDVACTSSGVEKHSGGKGIGNATACGICHSFSADGRCISLLKILMTNDCIFDCKYCANRSSVDVQRATFTPDEVCELTMGFYRRNYIEGLFLSSAIVKTPDYTMELILNTIRQLRRQHGFKGYIHVKAIPGADTRLIEQTGFVADRMSVNIELPSEDSLKLLAPNKKKSSILKPMGYITNRLRENRGELVAYRHATAFTPAGQSTQMIIGASPDTDKKIIKLSEALYGKYALKRVFYSAFVPVNSDKLLPALPGGPPLLREHRLYQADWLLRFYNFTADEILTEDRPNLNTLLDPKADWAVRNLEIFPVEVNKADYYTLLRVPGIGTVTAKRIVMARKTAKLGFKELKMMGVVLKRAQLFITCDGKMMTTVRFNEDYIAGRLTGVTERLPENVMDSLSSYKQISLFDNNENILKPTVSDTLKSLLGQM